MSRIHTCTPGHVSYGWIFADTRDREATITLTPQHIHASQHPRSHAVKRAAGACSVQATATARTQVTARPRCAPHPAPRASPPGRRGGRPPRRRGELKAAPRSGVCALGCRAHGRARARRTCGAPGPACPPGLSKIQTTQTKPSRVPVRERRVTHTLPRPWS